MAATDVRTAKTTTREKRTVRTKQAAVHVPVRAQSRLPWCDDEANVSQSGEQGENLRERAASEG
eukprot:scaffold138964_cov104-Cyclotella_meneghiniana.AAC.2